MADNDPFSVNIDTGGGSASSGDSGDSFTETTSQSWFSRIGGALTGVLVGLVLFIVSLVLLFWNEGRAVQTARSLTEGAGQVVEAAAGAIDPAFEGKLIHVTGPVTVQGQPADADFGVKAAGYALERKTEMFQWKETSSSETRKKLGGGEETVTTYHYDKVWSDRALDSGSFKRPDGHRNPPLPVNSRDFTVPSASLGAYALKGEDLSGLGRAEAVTPDSATAERLRSRLNKPVTASDTTLFAGQDASNPQVGDLRVSWRVWSVSEASLIAQQNGRALTPYQTKAGDRLFLKASGVAPASAMFKEAQDENRIITWILRLVGLVLLFVAFALMFRILSVLADVVPIFGDIVGFGTSLIALLLTASIGALTIGIAWLYYRPLIGIAVIVVGLGVSVLVARLGKARQAKPSFLPPDVAGAKR